MRFSLEYRNEDGRLAYYYPDFVARLADNTHLVLEAKGLADLNVPRKDERARRWAAEATAAVSVRWQYYRINEDVFNQYALQVTTVRALLDAVRARSRAALRESLPLHRRRSKEELLAIMNASLARGEVTGVDEEIRRIREHPRGV